MNSYPSPHSIAISVDNDPAARMRYDELCATAHGRGIEEVPTYPQWLRESVRRGIGSRFSLHTSASNDPTEIAFFGAKLPQYPTSKSSPVLADDAPMRAHDDLPAIDEEPGHRSAISPDRIAASRATPRERG